MAFFWNKNETKTPDPSVTKLGNSSRPVFRVYMGRKCMDMSFEQASNLWGELGAALKRERKAMKELGIQSADED
jgi:hypothetical protein